jgi:hypothetical protein
MSNMTSNLKSLGVLIAILFALVTLPSRAQNTSGNITGRITDTSGAVVPGAHIAVTNLGTGEVRSLTTDDSGNFTATLLLPGRYSVTVEHTGFKKTVQTGINLEINQTVRSDLALSLGEVQEQVEITAGALTLDTDSAAVSQIIDSKQVAELPLNGRSFTSLIFLDPSAVQTGGEQSTNRYGEGDAIGIGGGISSSNEYTVDGTMITDTGYATPSFNLSPDAIQEFKIQTKTYSAEYGFGVNQINISSKSGTNQFHGTVYEFIRNTAVDARDYFNFAPNPVAPLKQNQFGFALGGPVVVPFLYNGHKKTFFFANYEGLRIRSQTTKTGYMPLPAELTGVFQVSSISSNPTATIVNPSTGLPYPYNAANGTYTIPSSSFSRLGQLAARLFFAPPNANLPGGNYQANLPSNTTTNQQTYRIDQVFGKSDSAFVRATLSDVDNLTPQGLTTYTDLEIQQTTRNYQVTETHIFTDNLVNQFRIGYLEAQVFRLGPMISNSDAATLAFSNIFQLPKANYPVIGLTAGYNGTGSATQSLTSTGGYANVPTGSLQPAYDISDAVSWNRGNHTINFGFQWHALQLDRQSTVNPEGNFTFNGTLTHNQIADLLVGAAETNQVAQPGPVSNINVGNNTHLHFKAWAPYINDDWKATPKLTINMGIRYDFAATPYEEQNHFAWFDPNAAGGALFVANPSIVQTYGGSIYLPTGMRGPGPAQKGTFAPRLGFAFRPFNDNKTVLRGGYGVFFDSFQTNEFVSSTAIYPFAPTGSYTNTAGNPILYTNNLFPAYNTGAVTAATFTGGLLQIAAAKKLNPYAQDWNFGIERQLGANTILNLDYVANKATHLNIRTDPNQPTQCNATTNCNPLLPANYSTAGKLARRAYQNFGQLVYEGWNGYSNYNAFDIKLQRRAKDVTLLAAYSWSKGLDVKSAAAAVSGDAMGAFGPQNSLCLPCDYARSSYDVGNRFVAAFLYNLPFGEGQRFASGGNVFARKLISGWQFNGIGTIQGGFPFTVTGTDSNSVNEGFAERANLVGNPYPAGFKKSIAHWFSAAAFANPAPGYFGNSARNLLRGPGLANLDASIFKDTKVERFTIQLRFESFNALNHPEFGNPAASVTGGAAFTSISATNSHEPNRENQAAIKIIF